MTEETLPEEIPELEPKKPKKQWVDPKGDELLFPAMSEHIARAYEMMEMNLERNKSFIEIQYPQADKWQPTVVKFFINHGPVKESGVIGCRIEDMLSFVTCLYRSLNTSLKCKENDKAIEALEEAIYWQRRRTDDRVSRGVEGRTEQ